MLGGYGWNKIYLFGRGVRLNPLMSIFPSAIMREYKAWLKKMSRKA